MRASDASSSASRSHHSASRNGDEPRSTKARRSRLACRRCQQRKIKCDEAIPQCSACGKAGVQCEDGRRTGAEEVITRSQARYIEHLERMLRDKTQDSSIGDVQSDGQNDMAFDQPVDDRHLVGDTTHAETLLDRSNQICESPLPHLSTAERAPLSTGGGSNSNVAHEIGLVPLSGGANKYVGPSSGFVFAKAILNRARRASRGREDRVGLLFDIAESPSTTSSRSLFSIKPESLPLSLDHAIQLSRIYFEHIHIQHPFLHRPTFLRVLGKVYEGGGLGQKWMLFHVRMVLAISSTILSRRIPIPYSGEGLYASAMQDKDEVDFYNSQEGIQCLLLVYMFNLHSPYGNVSSWHLNYQCLAVVLDLGFQRDLPASSIISQLEREMRTRIFWVVYSIDRTLATILGRPIGLRDEGCDLRIPHEIEDEQLSDPQQPNMEIADAGGLVGSIACANILFKLANLNSELKYILHSVSQTTPRYTYPQINNLEEWQNDMAGRLQVCFDAAPSFTDARRYLSIICEIRYHEVKMHLFRPTPRIRSPKHSNLLICSDSATKTIHLWKELHKMDRLSYSWVMVHSLCLSALTILYGIWTSLEIARSTKIDSFMSTMREASVLMGIVGEYWIEARRSRDRLDELVNATTRWLVDNLAYSLTSRTPPSADLLSDNDQNLNNGNLWPSAHTATHQAQMAHASSERTGFNEFLSNYVNNDDLFTFVGASNSLFTDSEMLMDGLFVDYQPLFDLNGGEFQSSSVM